jgi:hypothetical protein
LHQPFPSRKVAQPQTPAPSALPSPNGQKTQARLAWLGLPEGLALAGLAGLSFPPLLGISPWTATAVVGVLLAAIFVARAARPQWKPALQLFELALAARLVVLTICYTARASLGLETVNPDVAGYLAWGREIAKFLPAFFDIRTLSQAATWDIGFHYVLGLEIWIFGDDPLTLLSINAIVGAAAVVALYLLLRLAKGKFPFLIASVAAFYPGLVFISGGDLFKDPWVLLAMLGGLALALRAAEKGPTAFLWALGAGLCFFILWITRFYTLPLALLCLGAGAIADGWRSRSNLRSWLGRWAIVAAGIAVGSGAPALLIKQPSILDESLSYTQVFHGPHRAFLAADGRIIGRLRWGEDMQGNKLPVGRLGPARIAADLVRRFYGPYLWVPPDNGSISLIEGSFWDYLAVPVWYVLLPLALVALSRFLLGRPSPLAAATLLGSVMTLLLICVFSISYRQRSSLTVPFLLLAVGLSADRFRWSAMKVPLLIQAGVILGLSALYYALLR